MSSPQCLYTRQLLDLYCGLPHTAARRPSTYDRQLADQLWQQNIPLELIQTAFRLAIARRSCRDPRLPALPPIRSLAYFLPVLEELRLQKLDPGYLLYLRDKVDQNSADSGER
ncbi:MAG TPA: hypothetical protein VMW27_06755 [Thermoanaerobaculia bacterium]|nr:hypothetical protein [Thermoanaerobaculia bacterium]